MRQTLAQLVVVYVAYRVSRGEVNPVSGRTIRGQLAAFVAVHGNRPVTQLGPSTVDRWLELQHRQGLAPGTIAGRLSALKTFARWCVIHGHVKKDFTLLAPKVRRPRLLTRDMTEDHIPLILTQCATSRDRLIVWLAYGAGLRCCEIHRLNVDDHDPLSDSLHVVGKFGHERAVPVGPPLRAALGAYLSEAGHRTGPLIRRATPDGGRLSRQGIGEVIARAIKAAGLKLRPGDGRSAHGLRAAAAGDLFDECLDARIVQEFLGHANLQTTSLYLKRAALERVREANEARFRETA